MSDLDNMVTVFDQYGNDFLSFSSNFGGKNEKVYLLREMLYDDHNLLDVEKLGHRLKKLPAVLTFYGTMLKQAEAVLLDLAEDFEHWATSREVAINTVEIQRINKMSVAASLKKAPTAAQLRSLVVSKYPEEWKEKKEKIRSAKDRADMLKQVTEGIKAAVDLARSESYLVTTMLNQGTERSSSPQQRSSGQPKNPNSYRDSY